VASKGAEAIFIQRYLW